MEFKEGVYEDLPFEEYNEIPAYRASDLKQVDQCVYTWKNRSGFTESPALLEGRVQHTVFLENHKFDDDFVIQPARSSTCPLQVSSCHLQCSCHVCVIQPVWLGTCPL